MIIVFLGPDGSGKSTILARLKQRLLPMDCQYRQFHLRPRFGQSLDITTPVRDPHGEPVRGKMLSVMKLGFWWIDYTLGFAIAMIPDLWHKKLLFFDRYFHDLLVDPRRYRYGGPMSLAKLISKSIPQPDIFFLLDAPAEILYARKQEVTFEETVRQREAYLNFIESLPNGYVLNATKPVDQIVSDVHNVLLRYLCAQESIPERT